jgi:hypothetical protein
MRDLFLVTMSALALVAASASAQETVRIPSVGPGGVATLPAAGELSRTCWMADVAAFRNRVHVHCSTQAGGIPGGGLYSPDYTPPPEADVAIVYFALGATSDPALADRVIALATSASQQNKQVRIFYRTNPAENPPGCLPSDCRGLTGLVLIIQP